MVIEDSQSESSLSIKKTKKVLDRGFRKSQPATSDNNSTTPADSVISTTQAAGLPKKPKNPKNKQKKIKTIVKETSLVENPSGADSGSPTKQKQKSGKKAKGSDSTKKQSHKKKKKKKSKKPRVIPPEGSNTTNPVRLPPSQPNRPKSYVLFIGNLPHSSTKDDVHAHFAKHVNVKDVRLMTEKDTGKSRGFGYLDQCDSESFEKALSMHHTFIGKRRVNVECTIPGRGHEGHRKRIIGEKTRKMRKLHEDGELATLQGKPVRKRDAIRKEMKNSVSADTTNLNGQSTSCPHDSDLSKDVLHLNNTSSLSAKLQLLSGTAGGNRKKYFADDEQSNSYEQPKRMRWEKPTRSSFGNEFATTSNPFVQNKSESVDDGSLRSRLLSLAGMK